MNRVPYRRVTPPRGRQTTATKKESLTAFESFIMQLTVSSVLMLIVLVISITNAPALAGLRTGIAQVLTGASTPGELMEDINHLRGRLEITETMETTITPPVFREPSLWD